MHTVCGLLCNLTSKHEGNRAAIACRPKGTNSCSLLIRMLKRLLLVGDGDDDDGGKPPDAEAKTEVSSVLGGEGGVVAAAEGKDGGDGQGNAEATKPAPVSASVQADVPNLKELDASGMRTVQWVCAVLRIVCIGVPENQATFGNSGGCDLVMRCKNICMHTHVYDRAYTHTFVC